MHAYTVVSLISTRKRRYQACLPPAQPVCAGMMGLGEHGAELAVLLIRIWGAEDEPDVLESKNTKTDCVSTRFVW